MRKQLFRFSLAVLLAAVAASPGTLSAMEEGSCPGHLYKGSVVCHNTSGTSCERCSYNCSDGTTPIWNTCNLEA